MSLMRWDPFRELVEMQRSLDDLFRRTFPSLERALPVTFRAEWVPAVEVLDKEGQLLVRAELPGVDPGQVEVTVAGDQLTIKGERKEQYEAKKENLLRREFRYGSFERCLALPPGADTENVKATFRNGILEISVPYQPKTKERKLTIDVEKS